MKLLHIQKGRWENRRKQLNRNSVREAFDNLPSGIGFFSQNGMPVLYNRAMYRIAYELMGCDLQNVSELRAALKQQTRSEKQQTEPDKQQTEPDKQQTESDKQQTESGKQQTKSGKQQSQEKNSCLDPERKIFRLKNGKAYRFLEEFVTDTDGNIYTQITAGDVTEFVELEQQMKEHNQNLIETLLQINGLQNTIKETVRTEQVHAMKARIHDDLGICITAAHQCLIQDKTLEEIQQNTKLWEAALNALTNRQKIFLSDEPLTFQLVLQQALSISVDIHLTGCLPEDEKQQQLVFYAMRECANNCGKHAHGATLFVKIKKEQDCVTAEYTNDGKTPQKKITEGGGLTMLRQRIEYAGGIMQTESFPEFKLIIRLPYEG